MKKLFTIITAILAIGFLAPVAQAGHSSNRRVVGYNQCGDAVYATWRVVAYQRCGTPVYGWVRERTSSSCSRPGRCNHHGHSQSRTVYRSGNSRLQVGYVSPRVTVRTSYRRSTPSRIFRSSRSRSSSCR